MKAVVTKIDIHDIDEWQAKELMAEMAALDIVLNSDKYPKLNELRLILSALFTSMVSDVHYISKRR